MNQLIKYLVLFLILVNAACSIEKRVHNRGYYIDWNRDKSYSSAANESELEKQAALDGEEKTTLSKPLIFPQTKTFIETNKFSRQQDLEIENDLPKKNISIRENIETPVYKKYSKQEKQVTSEVKNNNQKKIKKAHYNQNRPDGSGFKRAGHFLLRFGINLFDPYLFILSLMFFVLGLLFLLIGAIIKALSGASRVTSEEEQTGDNQADRANREKTEPRIEPEENENSGPTNSSTKAKFQDVIYLKNGGIIKGEIIEYFPGDFLKVRTKDGQTLTLKTSEISKTTKEEIIE